MATHTIEITDLSGREDGETIGYRVVSDSPLLETSADYLVRQLLGTLSHIAVAVDTPLPGPLPRGEGEQHHALFAEEDENNGDA